MNRFDDRSDAVQSQPTQLIDYALAAPLAHLEHDNGRRRIPERQQQDEGFSEESIVPPRREAVPRYFLCDQAPLTGQNNGCEEWGPQNENTTAGSKENKEHYHNVDQTRPSSPHDVQATIKEPGLGNSIPLTASVIRKVNGARAISCGPPNSKTSEPPSLAHPTKSLPPLMMNRYRRSPSPPSQDSFGGPVSQDPGEHFLATTRQFNVPLSDLGAPTQLDDVDPEIPLSDASEHRTSLGSTMTDYKGRRANSSVASPRLGGEVLVAATPSHTSESAEPSGIADVRRADVPFLTNVGADHGSQESTQPFDFDQTPSSFDRMLDKVAADKASRPVQEPVPTQTTVLDPTPPNVSTDVEPPTHPVSGEQSGRQRRSETPQWVSSATHAAVASSNPRSLLRLVNPMNEYRIAKLRQMHGDVAPPSYVGTSARAQAQLSSVEQRLPTKSTSEARHAPSRTETAGRPIRGYRESPDQGSDSLDVVPDSEPLRAGLSNTSNADVPDSSPQKSSLPARKANPEHTPRDHVSKPPGTQERFSESDDDDDVPLLLKLATKSGKVPPVQTEGRTRISRKPKSLPAATSTTITNNGPVLADERGKSPANAKGRPSVRGKSRSKEPTIVPSSAPEQDLHGKDVPELPSVGASSRIEHKKQKTKDVPTAPRGRSMSAASKGVKRKRPPSASTESSEDDGSSELPMFAKEEEEETEMEEQEEGDSGSTYDHDMDVVSPPSVPKTGLPHKRRRIEEVKPSSAPKGATSVHRPSATPAPGARSIKRLRSGASTSRAASEPATRVFALWKQDGHYYSGVVHSALPRRGSTKYLVKFDDGTEDEVELKNMRCCEPNVGDNVIVSNGARGKVSDVRELESRGTFLVNVDDGKKTMTSEVELADIRIANRALQNQWKNRILNPEAIVTVVKPRLLTDTATPSHQSLASLSGRPQRELAKTGFVVTLSPKNSNPEQTKKSTISAIEQHGGELIDDWSSVFTMEGRHSQSNKRWTVTPDDFHFKEGVALDRVFLLADDANQKPKFLIALALGIPCLSFEWLTKVTKFSEDWQPFLLSAGYSDALGARVSQLVDLDWGNCSEYLQDILSNRVSPKLFSDRKFLCIGADFVPPYRGRKNASNLGRVREATRAVPWIILCMGASKVEAITDIKQVSSKELRSFDYVIVKDTADVEDLGAVTVATVTWVKECLISSRVVPTNWTQA
ncbi:hypothetical protein M404DRAFT_993230 [Pisolithus tinctorius Marx 270]|uniref:BRCT domain-containing protein n=1 Tax=Pisolithus tinctorius Marx 270 TaxID=870435 RepID=A0A0C3JX23_PISTI|nr:hypothetical protein M404DRAFT_993230 [Pisolithus tinctorius Marx 270]